MKKYKYIKYKVNKIEFFLLTLYFIYLFIKHE